ncbi:MAG: hypothetical protein JNN08_10975 [Bryobacterales bacterium]|nr:hypothetical protein [Bryobacterales bacterium]
MRSLLRPVLAATIIGGAAVWLFREFLFPANPSWLRLSWDYTHLFWLRQISIGALISQGWPHWDHGWGLGWPVWKDPQSMYWHPLMWGPALARDTRELLALAQWAAVLCAAFGGCGIAAIARRLGASGTVALSSGLLALVTSEGIANRLEVGQLNQVATTSSLPWLVFLSLRPPRRILLYTAAVFVLVLWNILAGMQYDMLVGWTLLGVLVIGRIFFSELDRKLQLRMLFAWTAAVAAALWIALPGILMQIQGLTESCRWVIPNIMEEHLRALLSPSFLWSRWFVPSASPIYQEGLLYIGMATTFCLALSLYCMPKRFLVWAGVTALILFLHAMGDQTPAYSFMRHWSVFAPMGLPVRKLMYIAMAVAALWGLFLTPSNRALISTRRLLFTAAGVLAAGFAAGYGRWSELALPLVCFAAAVIAAILWNCNKVPQFALLSLCVTVVADHAHYSRYLFAQRYSTDHRHVIGNDRWLIDTAAKRDKMLDTRYYRPQLRWVSFGYNPVIPLRHMQFSQLTTTPVENHWFVVPPHLGPLLNLWQQPLASFYTNYRMEADGAAILTQLAPDKFDINTLLLHHAEWVRHKVAPPPPVNEPRLPLPLEAVRLEPDKVEVRFTAPKPGFLFLSQSFDPDWTVRYNGAIVPLVSAAWILSAVPISAAGPATVTFSYSPRWWRRGQLLQLLSLLVVIAFVWWRGLGHWRGPSVFYREFRQ